MSDPQPMLGSVPFRPLAAASLPRIACRPSLAPCIWPVLCANSSHFDLIKYAWPFVRQAAGSHLGGAANFPGASTEGHVRIRTTVRIDIYNLC